MKRTKEEAAVLQFALALHNVLPLMYCLGAASENEIRAAAADFLMRAARDFINKITDDTFTPAQR